jgi:hypothetical protein
MSELANDPVPPVIRDILALFAGDLRDQRCGDLDHAALERLAEATRERAKEVDRARAALETALAGLEAARDVLSTRAHQGLAYATVFAASDPALSATIAALEADPKEPRERRAAPRRKSAPKSVPARGAPHDKATELPFDGRAASDAA